jgi:hypothetical protein
MAFSVASNNVKYTDTTSRAIATGSATARSTIFFQFLPKYIGEVLISVDASISAGTATLRAYFPAQNYLSSGIAIGAQGGGSPIINNLVPLGTVTTYDPANLTNNQFCSNSFGTITTTPTTFTFAYAVHSLVPIYFGASSATSATITLSNFNVSYDVIK